jgi:hypothetical protein
VCYILNARCHHHVYRSTSDLIKYDQTALPNSYAQWSRTQEAGKMVTTAQLVSYGTVTFHSCSFSASDTVHNFSFAYIRAQES